MPEITITELSARIEKARLAITDEEQRHKRVYAGLRQGLKLVQDERAHALVGTGPEIRLLATHVVEVKWMQSDAHNEFDADVVEAAVVDLVNGPTIMRTDYIGVKNYSGFVHQRSDHKYGFGPKHGTIVFSVGLTPEVRKRLANDGELTDEEKDAAITYLLNLQKAGVA